MLFIAETYHRQITHRVNENHIVTYSLDYCVLVPACTDGQTDRQTDIQTYRQTNMTISPLSTMRIHGHITANMHTHFPASSYHNERGLTKGCAILVAYHWPSSTTRLLRTDNLTFAQEKRQGTRHRGTRYIHRVNAIQCEEVATP